MNESTIIRTSNINFFSLHYCCQKFVIIKPLIIGPIFSMPFTTHFSHILLLLQTLSPLCHWLSLSSSLHLLLTSIVHHHLFLSLSICLLKAADFARKWAHVYHHSIKIPGLLKLTKLCLSINLRCHQHPSRIKLILRFSHLVTSPEFPLLTLFLVTVALVVIFLFPSSSASSNFGFFFYSFIDSSLFLYDIYTGS